MNKTIATYLSIAALVLPAVATADTASPTLVSLYTRLIALLEQQITLLKVPVQSSGHQLVIDAPAGTAPYTVLIGLPTLDGTETVDFGDGQATGTRGCAKNAKGWCDLHHQIVHTYQLPGTYTVTLVRHDPVAIIEKATVTVHPAEHDTQAR